MMAGIVVQHQVMHYSLVSIGLPAKVIFIILLFL